MAAIEQNDPCLRAEQLKAIRDQIMLGDKAVETEFDAGNGVRRRVKFGPANLTLLNQQIMEAERKCALKNGTATPRFAITPR